MAKIVDITEKLSFEENPQLVVNGKNLELNADAATVLKLMGVLGEGGEGTPKQVVEMYNLLFSDKAKKEIEKMKLSFGDFTVLVKEALPLITGNEEDEEGEE